METFPLLSLGPPFSSETLNPQMQVNKGEVVLERQGSTTG